MSNSSPYSGLHHLTVSERIERLEAINVLDTPIASALMQTAHSEGLRQASTWIENAIGSFAVPVGIVPGVYLDGKITHVPLATEETSIIAALNRVAKWVRDSGELTTKRTGNLVTGQLYVPEVTNSHAFKAQLLAEAPALLDLLNQTVLHGMAQRGGGAKTLTVRPLASIHQNTTAHVIEIQCEMCDAMGANLVTMAAEKLKPSIEAITGEQIHACIVSNLSEGTCTQATLCLKNLSSEVQTRMVTTAQWACQDPARAATHNKGVMNAISALMLATGNDTRAVEAGIHAYAAKTGQYQPITHWRQTQKGLVGTFKAPLMLGTVGGLTAAHPMAQHALKIMKIQTAPELARITAGIGLMQNAAALYALSTDGLMSGHMRLHIDNLIEHSQATPDMYPTLKAALCLKLQTQKSITLTDVSKAIEQFNHAPPLESTMQQQPDRGE